MQRKQDESFEDYKKRRKEAQLLVKAYTRGRMIWNSPKEGEVSTRALRMRSMENQKQLEGFCDKIELI